MSAPIPTLHDRAQTALRRAMRDRDRVAVRVLRTFIARVDNASAVPVPAGADRDLAVEQLATGVGVADVVRREVSAIEQVELLALEIAEREDAATQAERGGHPEAAARLRQEAQVLARLGESG